MKNILTTLLLCLVLTGCNRASWSSHELRIIDQARYSRMALTTIDNRSDSLLLRTPSAPLSADDIASPTFGRLVASMIETVCDDTNPGVGIAAPQVGILRRLIVVERVDKPTSPFEVYVNPTIVWRSDECQLGPEGCLSVPNQRGQVSRSAAIEISYNDPLTFEPRTERLEGFVAVIFQHEIDHLDGVLYIDKIE